MNNTFSFVKTINVFKYNGQQLSNRNIKKFVEVVYKNFYELANNIKLNHTRNEIMRLLTSNKSLILISVIDNQIIGYLIAEITIIENLKQLMHISYLFTSPKYRGLGVATTMINIIEKYAKQQNINTLSLTFNVYDKNLEKFYFDNNFTYDSNLRSYQKYDMLVKYI